MTLVIMALCVKAYFVALSINDTVQFAGQQSAIMLRDFMLSDIMLSGIMLSDIMLSDLMSGYIMLSDIIE
jgi:hypothetical protein